MLTDEQKQRVKYFVAEYDIYIDVPESSVTEYDEVIPILDDTTGDNSQGGDS